MHPVRLVALAFFSVISTIALFVLMSAAYRGSITTSELVGSLIPLLIWYLLGFGWRHLERLFSLDMDLPTDRPQVLAVLIPLVGAVGCLALAYDRFTDHSIKPGSRERLIYQVFGHDGLAAFWGALALILIVAAIYAHHDNADR